MALILNIDTSLSNASICLASAGVSIGLLENAEQQDHAAWLHSAIEQLIGQAGHSFAELKAIAVTQGPGSYTGLRVGMATAKGLCYALNIPLITENTLRVMALASQQAFAEQSNFKRLLFCPMIDARRMEVFTALFDSSLNEVLQSSALILGPGIFEEYLTTDEIIFSGNGSEKAKQFAPDLAAHFSDVQHSAQHLAELANKKFQMSTFDDLAYSEPLYLKEFYTVPKNKK